MVLRERLEQRIPFLSRPVGDAQFGSRALAILRTCVHLRALLTTHADLRRKIEQMEKRYDAKNSVPSLQPPSRYGKCRLREKKRSAFMLSQAYKNTPASPAWHPIRHCK